MKTRVGKIAQLPKEVRDELNQRLQNGKQGPELLRWLNTLPETKELLAAKFDGVPISKQNLSEWRRGGYEEWLRSKEREDRIQRIIEDGTSIKNREDQYDDDAFEHSGRIALAELMADLDSLHKLKSEERTKRLRQITFELARLQNAYNRSRWAALAWTKWNDRFLGREDYVERGRESKTPLEFNRRPTQVQPNVLPNSIQQTIGTTESLEPTGEQQSSISVREQTAVKPSNTKSNGEEVDERIWLTRPIHYCKGCHCVCRNCHPENGKYPYAEALKDSTEAQERKVQAFWRGKTLINTQPTECNCACDKCGLTKSQSILPRTLQCTETRYSVPEFKTRSQMPQFDPRAEFLRKAAHLKRLTTS